MSGVVKRATRTNTIAQYVAQCPITSIHPVRRLIIVILQMSLASTAVVYAILTLIGAVAAEIAFSMVHIPVQLARYYIATRRDDD